MRKLVSTLLGGLLLIAIAAVGLLFMVEQTEPLVAAGAAPSAVEARWVRGLVDGAGPPLGADPAMRGLDLSPRQLDLLVDLAAQRLGGGHARVLLDDGAAQLLASFPIPWQRGGYANLRLQLHQTDAIPAITAAAVGGLPVPAAAVQRLAQHGLEALAWSELVQRVRLAPDGVRVSYRRSPDGLDAAATGRLTDADRDRLAERQAQLVQVIAAQPSSGRLDLAVLLSGLLALGADPAAPDSDAVADNRAALITLAAYVNGRGPALADAGNGRSPRSRTVQLRGRHDLAQHFMASAAMAAEGGSALSHMVGLAKELRDADGGSGFSFRDLTANRAGIRFAEIATGSAASARHVQLLARVGLDQDAIMPAVDGLPEGMQRAELDRTIGDVGSADYARLLSHIDRRIDNTGLYRSAPGG